MSGSNPSQSTKRVLPSRSSRPLRAAMQDGSDVDDAIEAMILYQSFEMEMKQAKKVSKRKKPVADNSDDDEESTVRPKKQRKSRVEAKKEKKISSVKNQETKVDQKVPNPVVDVPMKDALENRAGSSGATPEVKFPIVDLDVAEKKETPLPLKAVSELEQGKTKAFNSDDSMSTQGNEGEENNLSPLRDLTPETEDEQDIDASKQLPKETPTSPKTQNTKLKVDFQKALVNLPLKRYKTAEPVAPMQCAPMKTRSSNKPNCGNSETAIQEKKKENCSPKKAEMKDTAESTKTVLKVQNEKKSILKADFASALKNMPLKKCKISEPVVPMQFAPMKTEDAKEKKKRSAEEEPEEEEDSEEEDDIPSDYPSDDDVPLNSDIVKEASQLVKAVYQPIETENNLKMKEYFKGEFRSAILKMPKKQFKVKTREEPIPLELKPEQIKRGREVGRIELEDGSESRSPVHFISSQPTRPRMKYWTHIERNVKVEDNKRLSHIPRICQKELDYRKFRQDLLEGHSEGIHGVYDGWGKHISDYLLRELLKEAIPKWKETGNDLTYLWKGIYNLFPNKLPVSQFADLFETLERRFNRDATEKPKEEVKSDEVHDSIKTIYCIHCLQYSCQLHGIYGEELRMGRKPMTMALQQNVEPCGQHCFRLLEADSEHEVAVESYSNFAKTIFEKMVQNNRNTPCQLALMMVPIAPLNPKNCQQIHQMIKAIRPIGEKNGEKSKKTKASDIKKQKIAFKNALWKNKGGQVDNGEELHICNHRGPCSQTNEDCYCSQNNLICSPYCHCGPECRLRFPGCDCKPGQCRSDKCNCFFSNRECDPNICKSCNSGPYMFMKLEKTPKDKKCDEVSILTKKRKNKQLKCCKNVNLQRGNFKRLLVGESNIAGYGCFLDDTAEQGDFIAEYTGEIISTKEGERRGLIYDQLRCSYIFNLNQEESVDANRFGNHIRFVNHNDDPNCFCQIMVVNGEHRIGFFAKRRIHKGEELFFDYNYDKNAKKQYVPKS